MVFWSDFFEGGFPISRGNRGKRQKTRALVGGFVFLLVVLAYPCEQGHYPSKQKKKMQEPVLHFCQILFILLAPLPAISCLFVWVESQNEKNCSLLPML